MNPGRAHDGTTAFAGARGRDLPVAGSGGVSVGRDLVILGIGLVVVGLFWKTIARFPWGRLPGDFVVRIGDMRLHVWLATSLLVSLVVSLIAWLMHR